MFDISPDLYPWLAIGACVFVVVFGIGTYRIRHNKSLRTFGTAEPLPEQTSVQFGTIAAEVAPKVREDMAAGEATWLIYLLAAMAGYGPSVCDPVIREGAAAIMGDHVYSMFCRQFATVAHLPEGMLTHVAPITELSYYSMEHLLADDDMLTFMVTYAQSINKFFAEHQDNPELPQMVESDKFTRQATIGKLLSLHGKFYAS